MQIPTIITEAAESKLLTQLMQLREQRMAWHMMWLHGSQMPQGYQHIIRLRDSQLGMLEMIQHAAQGAYLCADADLFILLHDVTTEACEALRIPIRDLLPFLDQLPTPFEELLTIHPLARDYEMLLEAMRVKKFARLAQSQASHFEQERRAKQNEKQIYRWNPDRYAQALAKRRARQRTMALVVEDDSVVRQMASAVLRQHFHVLPASDGYAGLELFNHHAPDIVFLDIDMPYIDGLRVLQTMMEADPQTAIVMFTANNNQGTLKQALKMGARGFVMKPFTAGSLLQHARQAMLATHQTLPPDILAYPVPDSELPLG